MPLILFEPLSPGQAWAINMGVHALINFEFSTSRVNTASTLTAASLIPDVGRLYREFRQWLRRLRRTHSRTARPNPRQTEHQAINVIKTVVWLVDGDRGGTGVIVGEDEDSFYVLTNDDATEPPVLTALLVRQTDDNVRIRTPAPIRAYRIAGDPSQELALFRLDKDDIPMDVLLDKVLLAPSQYDIARHDKEGVAIFSFRFDPDAPSDELLMQKTREYVSRSAITKNHWFDIYKWSSPGASGAPVVDKYGQLIGLVRAQRHGEKNAQAIAMSAIRPFLKAHKVPGVRVASRNTDLRTDVLWKEEIKQNAVFLDELRRELRRRGYAPIIEGQSLRAMDSDGNVVFSLAFQSRNGQAIISWPQIHRSIALDEPNLLAIGVGTWVNRIYAVVTTHEEAAMRDRNAESEEKSGQPFNPGFIVSTADGTALNDMKKIVWRHPDPQVQPTPAQDERDPITAKVQPELGNDQQLLEHYIAHTAPWQETVDYVYHDVAPVTNLVGAIAATLVLLFHPWSYKSGVPLAAISITMVTAGLIRAYYAAITFSRDHLPDVYKYVDGQIIVTAATEKDRMRLFWKGLNYTASFPILEGVALYILWASMTGGPFALAFDKAIAFSLYLVAAAFVVPYDWHRITNQNDLKHPDEMERKRTPFTANSNAGKHAALDRSILSAFRRRSEQFSGDPITWKTIAGDLDIEEYVVKSRGRQNNEIRAAKRQVSARVSQDQWILQAIAKQTDNHLKPTLIRTAELAGTNVTTVILRRASNPEIAEAFQNGSDLPPELRRRAVFRISDMDILSGVDALLYRIPPGIRIRLVALEKESGRSRLTMRLRRAINPFVGYAVDLLLNNHQIPDSQTNFQRNLLQVLDPMGESALSRPAHDAGELLVSDANPDSLLHSHDQNINHLLLNAHHESVLGHPNYLRRYYYQAFYQLYAQMADRADFAAESLLFEIGRRIHLLNRQIGIRFLPKTDTFSAENRMRPMQEYLAREARTRWGSRKKPFTVYVVGIGDDGAPTVFDLANALREAGFDRIHVVGIDIDLAAIAAAQIAIKRHPQPRGTRIDFRYIKDFELTKLLDAGFAAPDLIECSNLMIHYDEVREAAAIVRMARALRKTSPVGWLVIGTAPSLTKHLHGWDAQIYNRAAERVAQLEILRNFSEGKEERQVLFRNLKLRTEGFYPYPGVPAQKIMQQAA